MQCPTCHTSLAMTDRQGIEIDYCPQCRGIWLDKGELDKLLARAANDRPERYADDEEQDRPRGSARSRADHRPAERRESWWSELFDFG